MEELIEKAVFVGIIRQNDDDRKVMEYLDELEFLAETAGAKGDKKFVQRLDKPEKATYIRSGKLQEIAEYCEENEIKYVIFDDELTGMQQRNIEKVINCSSVIDRTSLILEIFAQRAKTSYAKMQVSLHATTICYRDWQECGPTLRDREAVWAREVVWVRPRSRSTAV